MGRLVHTGLGSSSLIAPVLHYPPPSTRTALGTAVINTHTHREDDCGSSGELWQCAAEDARGRVQGRHILLQGLSDQGVEGWAQGRVRRRCAGHVYVNLGIGHMYLNEHVKAVACFEVQHAMAISLKLAHMQSHAALNMGVTLHGRAARQGPGEGPGELLT